MGWWHFPAHLALAFTLTLVIPLYLQDKEVGVSPRDRQDLGGKVELSQPDVVALISAALVVIRALGGAAMTLIGWKMIFLVLPTTGLNLRQLDRMISWRQPPLGDHLALWVVLFLSLPSQFAAPVIQGAVQWIPGTAQRPVAVLPISTAGPSPRWNQHNFYPNNRYYEVMRAIGIASLASSDNFEPFSFTDPVPSIPVRRLVPSVSGVPIGSELANISLPVFRIHSLKWASFNDVSGDMDFLNQIIFNVSTPNQTFSNWLTGSDGGNLNLFNVATDDARLTIVNDRPWQVAPLENPLDNQDGNYTWPVPTVRQAQTWVVLGINFLRGCADDSTSIGPIPDSIYHYPNSSCYIFAKINYTAGVMTCPDCRVIQDGVVEAPANKTSNAPIEPDPLVSTAVAMLPEVLFYMKIANSSLAPTWHNLDGYVSGTIATAYQASWNSLANTFGSEASAALQDATELSSPVSILRADVKSWRVWLWFGLQVLLTLAGLLLFILESRSHRKSVHDPILTGILLDSRAVSKLQDTKHLTRREWNKKLRLQDTARGDMLLVFAGDSPSTGIRTIGEAGGSDRDDDSAPRANIFRHRSRKGQEHYVSELSLLPNSTLVEQTPRY